MINMAVVVMKTRDTATPYFDRMMKRLPVVGDRTAWNVAQKGAKMLKHHAKLAGIRKWRGKLFSKQGIRAKKKRRGVFQIIIPYYGYELDQWRGGYKQVRRGTLLAKWIKTSPKSPFKGRRGMPRQIWVRPHPFIEQGWRSLDASTPTELERLANNILRG